MRIRKNASKLLGSPFYLPSSSSDFARNEVEESTGIFCQFSSNPWDLLEFEDYIYYNNVANLKEKEEDDEGILGNAIIIQDMVVEPIATCLEEALPSTTKSELTTTTEATPVKKKRGRKKKNNIEEKLPENETNNNTTKYCKKTDGKGWYCKREVEHPHTLCSYHIAQLRTYTTTHSLIKSTCCGKEKIGMVDESSSLYYYYDGFGPCNGKRREKVVQSEVAVYEKDEQGVDDDEENSNVIIAGDDEYDNDVFEFDDDDEDDDDDGDYCDVREKNVKKEVEKLEEEKKKKVYKKRGRKPIKARSLKSIL